MFGKLLDSLSKGKDKEEQQAINEISQITDKAQQEQIEYAKKTKNLEVKNLEGPIHTPEVKDTIESNSKSISNALSFDESEYDNTSNDDDSSWDSSDGDGGRDS